MAACIPYLDEQLDLIKPRVIVALGATAVQGLLGTTEGITRLRGRWKQYRGQIDVMPTFHPAYLLRTPSAKREVWDDLQEVLRHVGLERSVPGAPMKRSDRARLPCVVLLGYDCRCRAAVHPRFLTRGYPGPHVAARKLVLPVGSTFSASGIQRARWPCSGNPCPCVRAAAGSTSALAWGRCCSGRALHQSGCARGSRSPEC